MHSAKKIEFYIIALIIIIVALLAAFSGTRDFILKLGENYGYLGLFVFSFLGGISFVIPLPYPIVIIALVGLGFNPWLLALVAAVGASLGDVVSYFLGRSGGDAYPEQTNKFRFWLEEKLKKYPKAAPLILFLWASFVPFPNEIFVIPFGVSRYGLWRTLLFTGPGNFVFSILVAKGAHFLLI